MPELMQITAPTANTTLIQTSALRCTFLTGMLLLCPYIELLDGVVLCCFFFLFSHSDVQVQFCRGCVLHVQERTGICE